MTSGMKGRVLDPTQPPLKGMHGDGLGCNIFGEDRRGLNMWRVVVNPGVTLESHSHPPDEIYLLTKGNGRLRIGEEVFEMATGQAAWIPSGIEHEFVNNGDRRCEILAFSHLPSDAPMGPN